jgi:hypothetical protein
MKNIFILGAGASKPYGFPTGMELREWSIKNVYNVFDSNDYLKQFISRKQQLDDFKIAFNKSNTNSIDLFLTRNKQYDFIGKAIIAHKMIECEKRGLSYIEDKNDDWYFFFYNRLTDGITEISQLKNIFNDFSFMTFNYDRSFESYFSESFFYSFFSKNPSFDEIDHSIIPKTDIFHIYGSLGNYPDTPYMGNTRYIPQVFEPNIKSIKTIYDEREVNAEIKNRIIMAQRIFFLGFSYLPENMEKLGLSKIMLTNKEIYGTAYGSLDAEIRRIERYFEGVKVCQIKNEKTTTLLKMYL